MSKHILEPLGDRVLVRQIDAKDKSDGGIIIPDAHKQKPKEAKVVSVGPGKRLENGDIIPVQVQAGDYVVFASYAGQQVEVDGEEFLLLSSEEILARVKEG